MEKAHFQGEGSFPRRRLISTDKAHFYRGGQFLCNMLTQESIPWSVQLPYWAYVTAFSQNGLFLDYLFAGNRLLEFAWVIRSMKREEKNGGPMRGRLHIKTTQIPPFFCYIPVFQSFLSLYISLSFAKFSRLRKNSRKCRSLFYF